VDAKKRRIDQSTPESQRSAPMEIDQDNEKSEVPVTKADDPAS
jgi:hypothetical protein